MISGDFSVETMRKEQQLSSHVYLLEKDLNQSCYKSYSLCLKWAALCLLSRCTEARTNTYTLKTMDSSRVLLRSKFPYKKRTRVCVHACVCQEREAALHTVPTQKVLQTCRWCRFVTVLGRPSQRVTFGRKRKIIKITAQGSNDGFKLSQP